MGCNEVVVPLFLQGLGCFSGFLVSMLVAYLLMKRKIVKMMSGYQVLRSTLQFLGEFPGASGLEKVGVSAQSLNTVGEEAERPLCFFFLSC